MSRVQYDAVAAMMRCGLSEYVRIWIRAPFRRLAYLGIATSPISYRSTAAWTARFFPEPGVTPPPDVEAQMREVMARRGLPLAKEDPWITSLPRRQREVERILASRAMAHATPFMRAYMERAPRWAEGHCPVVWLPIDLRNILHALRTLVWGPRYR